MHRHTMKSGAGDLHVHRFSSDDVAQCDRLAFMREVVLRKLPDLGPASTDCSGIHAERRAAQIDSDDLVLHITLAGKRIVRQFGRDAVVGAGELAVARSSDVASWDCDPAPVQHPHSGERARADDRRSRCGTWSRHSSRYRTVAAAREVRRVPADDGCIATGGHATAHRRACLRPGGASHAPIAKRAWQRSPQQNV